MIRRLAAALAALVLPVIAAGSAEAMAPYVVVDVNSGRVLMAEDATAPWYPASVTKLMTVYVTLRQLEAGAIGLETPIPVSRAAASAPPSKIGVRPGQEVTLDNAMKMLLVKSANDMAVVIAEGVGGTVENFADMMNREAQRIGMRESHFVNPNGLFVEGQQTSARDMAVLARTILKEFPDYASYFNIGALQLGKRVLKNTNGLIGRYPGIEGMKTGFICASGFNLVALASRNGQRLIAVVFGASSNAERTLRAAEMLDRGFSTWGSGIGTLESLASSPIASPPNMKEDICIRRKGPAPSEEEADTAMAATASQADDGRVLLPGAAPVAMVTASGVRAPGARTLAPRAELAPIPVSIGRTAGSASAPLAVNATQRKSTATAYADGKGKAAADAAPGAADAPGPLTLKQQATQVPLVAAGRKGAEASATVAHGKPAAESKLVKSKPVKSTLVKSEAKGKSVPAKSEPAKSEAKGKAVAPSAKPNASAKPVVKPAAKGAAKPAGAVSDAE